MQTPGLDKPELDKTDTVLFAADQEAETHYLSWLNWVARMLPQSSSLFLFSVHANKTVSLSGAVPETATVTGTINNAVLSCLHHRQAIYHDDTSTNRRSLLVVPLPQNAELNEQAKEPGYILVLSGQSLSAAEQSSAVQVSQWAALRMFAEPSNHEKSGHEQFSHVEKASPDSQLANALLQATLKHNDFPAVAFTLVNEIARLCGCVRVSLGVNDADGLSLVAMSGQSRIDDRRQIARQLFGVMKDTLTEREMTYPSQESSVVPSLQAYYETQGRFGLLSFVLSEQGEEQFVLVLEREHADTFLPAQVNVIKQTAEQAGPLLSRYYVDSLSPRKTLKRAIRSQLHTWSVPRSWSKKRIAAIACSLVLLLSLLIPVTHRVSADAYIEPTDRQILVSAQDGFILSAHARAGDFVKQGDVLATLDSKDLELSVEKWDAEKLKNEQAYAQALAAHDRTEMSRLRAELQGIDAELDLLREKMQRSELRAPFDGILIEGDLTQSLGAPVSEGDALFQIASAEQYRLILKVDEHDIGYISAQQTASLRMAAIPDAVWQAELQDLMPVAVSTKGKGSFHVPATIHGDASRLRPGMQGVGKIDIGKRSVFWVYTHGLLDRLSYLGWRIGLL